MISILLAEAVLDQQGRISTVQDSGNEVTFYGKESEFLGTYNIYELAHKCKEWALKDMQVRIDQSAYYMQHRFIVTLLQVTVHNCADTTFDITCDTEQECIFKSCQWILDSKGTL